MTNPNVQPVFSHQTEDEPVAYPAGGQDETDLNEPFSAPESANR